MTAAIPRRPLLALFIAASLGNAWTLRHAGTLLIGNIGLPPQGTLFTVHLVLAMALVAVLSLRCELFLPTTSELAFFLGAGLLGGGALSALVWPTAVLAAPLAFGLYAILLARYAPSRLTTLQIITGTAAAAALMLMPLARSEGELFLIEGRLGPSDLALSGFALTIGGEYYLLTLLARIAGTMLISRQLDGFQ